MCRYLEVSPNLQRNTSVSVNVDFPRFAVAAAMPLAGFSLAGGGANNALGAAAGLRMPGVQTTGSVLLISNLNEEVTFEPFSQTALSSIFAFSN